MMNAGWWLSPAVIHRRCCSPPLSRMVYLLHDQMAISAEAGVPGAL